MKKNFTFNIDSKYDHVLKILKYLEKRSKNQSLECIIDLYLIYHYHMCVDEFLAEYKVLYS